MSGRKFSHYFEVLVDVVYISGFIGLISFTISTIISHS